MSLAGTLMILVSLLTNKWVEGHLSTVNFESVENVADTVSGIFDNVKNGDIDSIQDAGKLAEKNIGLFKDCMDIQQKKLYEGECFPTLEELQTIFTRFENDEYPHAWRGAIVCFGFGLALMVITDLFALLTACCRSCICCSVFTICGSLQSFAGILFVLGLVAYPAGWGSKTVKENCAGNSEPFFLSADCSIGVGFWVAVAGTVCTVLASSLAIWAYKSTKSNKCQDAKEQGEHCICLI